MNTMLLKKSIREALPLFLACVVALFAFAWVRVWVTGLFEFTEVQEILQRFKRFERFSPIPFDQLASYEGRVAMTYDEPIVMLCVVIWSIARGSDIVSGELSRGTMEMLLSQPIRRITLLKTQVLVATVGLWGIVLSHFIGVACGIHTVSVLEAPPSPVPGLQILGALVTPENRPEPIAVALSERVQAITFIPASINLAAFGFLVFGLAAIISCCDSFRWRTIGLTVGIHVLQLVLFGISQATDRLAWLGWLTYFSAYQPQELTLHSAKSNLDNWTDIWGQTDALLAILGVGMLVVLGGVFIMVGRWQFNRRDLDPPF